MRTHLSRPSPVLLQARRRIPFRVPNAIVARPSLQQTVNYIASVPREQISTGLADLRAAVYSLDEHAALKPFVGLLKSKSCNDTCY